MFKNYEDYARMNNVPARGLGFATPAPNEAKANTAEGEAKNNAKTLSSEKRRLDHAYKKEMQRKSLS
jgi:hypothetical protein